MAVVGGVLLLIGYLTRFGTILVALVSLGSVFSWPLDANLDFFASQLSAVCDGNCRRPAMYGLRRFFSRCSAFRSPGNSHT